MYANFGFLSLVEEAVNDAHFVNECIELSVDGVRIELPPSLAGVSVINLPSYMGGCSLWGTSTDSDQVSSISDPLHSVYTLYTTCYTLHYTRSTLHAICYTLHSLYTLHVHIYLIKFSFLTYNTKKTHTHNTKQFKEPSIDDGLLEVVGLCGSLHMVTPKFEKSHGTATGLLASPCGHTAF